MKKSAMSGKKKGHGHVHEMRVRHGKSGGYIVSHHSPDNAMDGSGPDEYPIQDMAGLQSHIDQHMQPPAQDDQAAAAQGQAGGPAPMAAAGGMQ